ncbi:hypothetical protein, partial [Actinocorallia libanotica]|uniref:hypothetical protein n=1 Tax=Actinocorallia libanotica TaxID=46162 RepID=UPI0031E15BB4
KSFPNACANCAEASHADTDVLCSHISDLQKCALAGVLGVKFEVLSCDYCQAMMAAAGGCCAR